MPGHAFVDALLLAHDRTDVKRCGVHARITAPIHAWITGRSVPGRPRGDVQVGPSSSSSGNRTRPVGCTKNAANHHTINATELALPIDAAWPTASGGGLTPPQTVQFASTSRKSRMATMPSRSRSDRQQV